MGILSWILLGFIAGAIAKALHPGKDRGGCLYTILLGIAGALLGGYIGTFFGWGRVRDFSLRSLALAIFGALIILVLSRVLLGRRR